MTANWTGRCLALLTLLASLSTSACDARSDDAGKVRLVLAVAAGQSERVMYQDAVRQFTSAHPHIEVEILEIPGNYYRKLLVMIAGRNAPDLMWMGSGFTEFAQRGALLDLTARIDRDIDQTQFYPEVFPWYTFDNKRYGIPFGIDTMLIAYNKKMFDEAGVNYPSPNWTFDEFLEKARRLTLDKNHDGQIDQYGFRGELDVSVFGASFMSEDGQAATATSPQVLDYLQVNLDLAEIHGVSPSGKQLPNYVIDDPVSLFQQRTAAMMTMATWNLPYLRARCGDMDWDIATNPIVRQPGHWASSQAIVISRDTSHPDEAWLLAQQFLGGDFQRAMGDRVLPANRTIAADIVAQNTIAPQNLQAFIDATSSMYTSPRIANSTELGKFWADSREKVFSRRATPEDGMRELQQQLTRVLEDKRRLSR